VLRPTRSHETALMARERGRYDASRFGRSHGAPRVNLPAIRRSTSDCAHGLLTQPNLKKGTDMLRSPLLLALVTGAIALSVAGCGSDTESTTTPAGGDQTGTQPPEAPAAGTPGDGPGVVLAVSKLFLGDTNRDGSPNKASGWKDYGFNLDRKLSTKESADLCKPAGGGAPSSVYPDGNGGIDNSFGKNILPIILGLAPDASTQINDSVAQGAFTIMLDVQKLGSATVYNPLTTKLYAGGDLGMAPKFDGTDMWPVRPELLNDPTDIGSSKVVFGTSYVVDDTWVSGSAAPLDLSLSVAGFSLKLTIGSAIIAMKLDPDHQGATGGTIAGIIDTESFIEELRKVAGNFDAGLCMGSTFDGLANQLRAASDIMKDGSQDASKTCDGISIGLGFDAGAVQLGAIGEPSVPGEDPCAPM